MNDEQQAIWQYLTQNASGFPHRKSSTEIRQSCRLDSGGPTNEHVRDLIRDMILNHHCCIGSVMYKDGYWVIQDEEELNKATVSLERRADGVRKRAEALRNNWEILRSNG